MQEALPYEYELAQGQLSFFNRYDYDRFSNFFNWTMTYRSDSDIPTPYGRVIPKSSGFSYVPNSGEEGRWEHTYDSAQASQLSDFIK